MRIVAIDPGAHCGIATRLDDGSLQHLMIHNDKIEVWRYIESIQPQVIVVERFATGGMISRDGLDTVELQGSIFGLGWRLGAQIYVQSPGDRKPFEEIARQLIGANRTKIQSHDVDAVAHLLRWEWMEEHNKQRKPYIA